MPLLKKKDDIDLELAPLFAMDQIGKAKAARGAPPFDVFVLDPGPRIVGIEGGLFEKFDGKKLSNLPKIPAGFTDEYGVCVSAQVVGIAYNPKKVPAPKGWTDLLKDPWVSRLGLTGFQTTFGTSSLIELSKQFGGSLTNVDPALVELKKVLPKVAAVGLPAAMPGLFQQGQCDVMYTNTQTVATLKGKGIDVEFVKPESGAIAFYTTMHIAKGTAEQANAYKYLDLVVGKDVQEALTKPPYNFIPVNKDVVAAGRPADEEPRRDVEVRRARLGQDQSAARRLDREVQQGNGEVILRFARIIPSPSRSPRRGGARRLRGRRGHERQYCDL